MEMIDVSDQSETSKIQTPKALYEWQQDIINEPQNKFRYEVFRAVFHDIKTPITAIQTASGLFRSIIEEYQLSNDFIGFINTELSNTKLISEGIGRLIGGVQYVRAETHSENQYPDNRVALCFATPFTRQSQEILIEYFVSARLSYDKDTNKDLLVEELSKVASNRKSENPAFDMFVHELRFFQSELSKKQKVISLGFSSYRNDNLRDPPLTEGQKRALEIISRNVNVFGKCLSDSLEIGMADKVPEIVTIDPLNLLNELINNGLPGDPQEFISRLNIINPSTTIQNINSDPVILSAALRNVILNSLKYGVQVDPKSNQIVSMPPVEIGFVQTKDQLVIKVTDHGIGIDPIDLPRFVQQNNPGRLLDAKRSPIEGTGFGLFFSRLALSKIGGKIDVESPGKGMGSTFSIIVPRDSSNFELNPST